MSRKGKCNIFFIPKITLRKLRYVNYVAQITLRKLRYANYAIKNWTTKLSKQKKTLKAMPNELLYLHVTNGW